MTKPVVNYDFVNKSDIFEKFCKTLMTGSKKKKVNRVSEMTAKQ